LLPQTLGELPQFLEDVQIAREAYLKRCALADRYRLSEEVVGAEN